MDKLIYNDLNNRTTGIFHDTKLGYYLDTRNTRIEAIINENNKYYKNESNKWDLDNKINSKSESISNY